MKINTIIISFLLSSLLFSCGKLTGSNPKIPGIKGPYLKILPNSAILQLSAQVELPYNKDEKIIKIPKLTYSKIRVFAAQETKNLSIEINLDIAELIELSPNAYDPQTLPGGRPLPGVLEGKLPAAAIIIPELKSISFYIGAEVFGIFIPVPKLNKFKNMVTTARFRIKGNRVGNISIIGGDSNEKNAGILLLLDIDETIKDNLRKYYL